MVDLVADTIRSLELPARRMTSSAGHDAKFIAGMAPTAMLFVRTLGGMSHCETEAVDWEDAELAAEALFRLVARLADDSTP
jgi:N-carbamoyl-L-amino-acid hydrolase